MTSTNDPSFETSDEARRIEQTMGNVRSEDMVPILRKRSSPTGETQIKYYVVDSVEALQKFGVDAWDRVICVVTTGQVWQFKPYKWMDPKVLFRNGKSGLLAAATVLISQSTAPTSSGITRRPTPPSRTGT